MSNPVTPSGNRPLEQLKVAELREELRKRGLGLKGVKKELLERLEEAVRKEGQLGSLEVVELGISRANEQESHEGNDEPVDSEGEGEEFDRKTDGGPNSAVQGHDVVTQNQDAEVALGHGDLTGMVKDTLSQASELDPAPREIEAQKELVDSASGNDGSVPGVVDYVNSSMHSEETVPAVENSGPSALKGAACKAESGLTSEVTENPPQDPGRPNTDFENPKEEAGHSVEDPPANPPTGELDIETKPAVETLEQVKSIEPACDVEMAEVHDVGGKDCKMEELESSTAGLTSDILPAGTQSVPEPEPEPEPEPVPRAFNDEEKCFTTMGYMVDVKYEPEQSEMRFENRHESIEDTEDEGMDCKTESPKPSKEWGKLDEVEAEKPGYEAAKSHKIDGEDQMRLEGTAGGQAKELEDGKEGDFKSIDTESQFHAGQKRKDEDREIKQQEPAKRQRRWNSGNKLIVEPSKPLTTGTVKEITSPENKEIPASVNATSKATSSTPKILATSRPTPPAVRQERFANGEREKQRVVPPPARSPTTSLRIDRFIRPFTLKAVKDLLSQFGDCTDFWMDQIKTHCYVTYSSVDEAIASRNALYDKSWPPIFGNPLVVEFVEPNEVKMRCEGLLEKANVTPVTTPRGMPNPSPTPAAPPAPPQHAQTAPLPLPPPPVRERPALPPKKEPEPPIPTLDDLFKKTKAKPHIYYLPLTDEEVAGKLAARSKEQLPKNNPSTVRG